ncbi:mitogen-activated protein kinase kinase kinase 13-like [Cetorhinus maximus]
MELNAVMLQLELKEKELLRREQALDKSYPGIFKHQTTRPLVHTNSVEKLLKKRHTAHTPPAHSKRPDLLRSEVILPKLDSAVTQVALSGCQKGSGPAGRCRQRVKSRYRKAAGKGSQGDLLGLGKASVLPEGLSPVHGPACKDLLTPCSQNLRYFGPAAVLRGHPHDLLQKKLSSSSPDLICTTQAAESHRQEAQRPGSHPGGQHWAGQEAAGSPATPGERSPRRQPTAQTPGSAARAPDEGPRKRRQKPPEGAAQEQPSVPSGRATAAPRKQKRGISSEEEEGEVDSEVEFPRRPRRSDCFSTCQSLSTFSSENFSVSDGDEGNTSDLSHSCTPDVLSTNTDERLDERSDEILSQSSEIPVDLLLQSDGLSEKEAALQQVRSQVSAGRLCPLDVPSQSPLALEDSDFDVPEMDQSVSVETGKAPRSSSSW